MRSATRSACSGRSSAPSSAPGVIGSVIQQRARKLDTLSFSREQEYQADTLGLRYMIAAGYDPAGGAEMLAALSRADRARGAGPGPDQPPDAGMGEHPSAERESACSARSPRRAPPAGSAPGSATATLSCAARGHLRRRRSGAGHHRRRRPSPTPTCASSSRVPPGYLMSNGTDAVTISGRPGKAQFSGGQLQRHARQLHPARVFQQLTARPGATSPVPPPQRMTINGMPAAITTARANTSSGVDRRQRRRLSMGSAARLSFRDADAGRVRASARSRRWSIRCAGSRRRKRRRSGRG